MIYLAADLLHGSIAVSILRAPCILGVELIPREAPIRTTISDFGARIKIMERSVPLAFRIVAVQGALAAMLTMMFLMLGRAHAVAALLSGVVVIAPSIRFCMARDGDERVAAGRGIECGAAIVGGGVAKAVVDVGLLVVAFAWYAHQSRWRFLSR